MIKNLFEAVSLLKAAPKNMTDFKELLNYARNIYKEATGVFPDGIDFLTLKNAAKEVANIRDPKKVVQFPGGGKNKTNPFKERPGEGELSVTIEGETKNMTPEGIMDFIMSSGLKGTKPTKKQGELFNISGQKGKFLTEDEFARELESNTANFIQNSPGFNLQLIPNLKKPGAKAYNPYPDKQGDKFLTDDQRQRVLSKLEKIMKNEEYQMRFADNFADLMEEGDDVIEFAPDMFKIDPPKKADGGRIGFDKGGDTGFAGDQMEGDQYVMSDIPGSPQIPMGQFGPVNIGIFGGGSYGKNEIIPGVNMATTNQNYGIMGQVPIGNTGFSIGADYMKSRANERFTGDRIPGQVFKNVPTDSDRFNIGINYKKTFKDGGRIGFKDGSKPPNPGRRNFMKLMAGLASIPVVGKFFKPAAKVADAAPVIQEGAKLGFENFMLLVDKIKRLGRSADNLATKEREKVIRYEGKDGSEYELVEDLTTGDISVTRDKPGVAVYNRGRDDAEAIDVIEDRSTFIYRKGDDVVDTKTGKSKRSPDEYEELKQTSGDGEGFDGIDEIDDNIVNDVINELTDVAPIDDLTANQYMGTKSLRSKKAGGGLAYMLGE